MQRRSLVAFGMIGVCGVLAACQTTPAKKSGRNKAKTSNAAIVADRAGNGGEYRDPVARATLREKALTFLASAAASGPAEERANAIESLQVSPARLYPILDSALTDPTVGVRSVAAMTVGRAKLDAAASKVQPLLSDSAPQVRIAAMYALRRCGEPVDLTPMAGLLNDADVRVRAQTAFLLGELGEPSAMGLLRDSARSSVAKASPSEVRLWELQLAEARVKLGDEGALQEIRVALFPAKPEDLEATALACQILGQVKDQVSINRLIVLTAVQDDSKQFMPAEIRLGAAAALARMGQRQGSYIADQYRTNPKDALRAQSAFVYGETRQVENLPTLAEMMNDPIGRVRVSAAAAIVKVTEAGGLDGMGGGSGGGGGWGWKLNRTGNRGLANPRPAGLCGRSGAWGDARRSPVSTADAPRLTQTGVVRYHCPLPGAWPARIGGLPLHPLRATGQSGRTGRSLVRIEGVARVGRGRPGQTRNRSFVAITPCGRSCERLGNGWAAGSARVD